MKSFREQSYNPIRVSFSLARNLLNMRKIDMVPVDSGNSSGKLARSRLSPAVQRAQLAQIPELGAPS